MISRLILTVPVARRSHPRMGLEKLVEHALVGEVELIDNLLYGAVGVFEHIFGLEDDKRVYPVRSRTSADLLDELRKVFGRKAQLFGIESHIPFGCMVFGDKLEELFENDF